MLKVAAKGKSVHPKLLDMLIDIVNSFYQCSQFQVENILFSVWSDRKKDLNCSCFYLFSPNKDIQWEKMRPESKVQDFCCLARGHLHAALGKTFWMDVLSGGRKQIALLSSVKVRKKNDRPVSLRKGDGANNPGNYFQTHSKRESHCE